MIGFLKGKQKVVRHAIVTVGLMTNVFRSPAPLKGIFSGVRSQRFMHTTLGEIRETK